MSQEPLEDPFSLPPTEQVIRILKVGHQVKVKRGIYKGHHGRIWEDLTPDPESPDYLIGRHRYGVRLDAFDNIFDYCRYELSA